jgi:hypothetical protein
MDEILPVASAGHRLEKAQMHLRSAKNEMEIALAARAAYEAIADACHAYYLPSNLQAAKPEVFPSTVALVLHTLVANALAGNRESSFESLFRVGTPGFRVQEKSDIQCACRFVQAAKAGLIDEPHPIKRLAEWFGVSPRTIHSWIAQFGANDLLTRFFPDAGSRGELIASQAVKAGYRYSNSGRGQKAIKSRNRKRKR